MPVPISLAVLADEVRYTRHASLEILRLCEAAHEDELHRHMYVSHGSLLGTLYHTYAADAVWFARLKGDPLATLPGDPPDSLAALRERWIPVLDGLGEFVSKLSEDDITREVPFRSTTRGDNSFPVWRVIMHVVNHGSYHRGQAAALLRQLGHNVVSTDMSFYWMDNK